MCIPLRRQFPSCGALRCSTFSYIPSRSCYPIMARISPLRRSALFDPFLSPYRHISFLRLVTASISPLRRSALSDPFLLSYSLPPSLAHSTPPLPTSFPFTFPFPGPVLCSPYSLRGHVTPLWREFRRCGALRCWIFSCRPIALFPSLAHPHSLFPIVLSSPRTGFRLVAVPAWAPP